MTDRAAPPGLVRRWVSWTKTGLAYVPGPHQLVLLGEDIFAQQWPPPGRLLDAMAEARWPRGGPKVHQPIFVVPTQRPMTARDSIDAYQLGAAEPAPNIVLALHVDRPQAMRGLDFFVHMIWPRRALYLEPMADLDITPALRGEDKPAWILVRNVFGLNNFQRLWDAWRTQASIAGVPIELLDAELDPAVEVVGTRPEWAW